MVKDKLLIEKRLVKFEETCRKNAEDVKEYTRQTKFLKSCKYAYVGKKEAGNWSKEERIIRLDILDKYFPGAKQKILEYEKSEMQSQLNKQRIKEKKESLQIEM